MRYYTIAHNTRGVLALESTFHTISHFLPPHTIVMSQNVLWGGKVDSRASGVPSNLRCVRPGDPGILNKSWVRLLQAGNAIVRQGGVQMDETKIIKNLLIFSKRQSDSE